MLMRYNVEWTCYGIIFPVNTLLTLTLVVSISTLKELLPNDCYMMNSGRGALFCTHYINDMGTQDRSTAGLGKSIKYSAGSSALRRPCWSFREAVACLPVMSSLIKVWSGGCGEQVYVRGRVCVCVCVCMCVPDDRDWRVRRVQSVVMLRLSARQQAMDAAESEGC